MKSSQLVGVALVLISATVFSSAALFVVGVHYMTVSRAVGESERQNAE